MRPDLVSWLVFTGLAAATVPQQQPLRDSTPKSHKSSRPNILFILTDDQDVHLESLDYMPFVKKHLLDQGTHFTRHYCTTAICCPSRVTIWTGKAAHNHNVTDVSPPYGGYPKFISQGLNDHYLPVWLQDAGYNTYYTGKLFNMHTVNNYNKPYPRGFTGTEFLLDPYTYDYLNSTFQHNEDAPVSHEGEYLTDVLTDKAYALLDEAVQSEKPFFLTVAPIAPHSNVYMNPTAANIKKSASFSAPIPAKRHEHLFEDVKAPRTLNFNPEEPSGANWIRSLHFQNDTNVDYNDYFYRSRLRALQAVDELVDGLFARLADYDLLSNTYIFYSSDNGFHIGQHRLQPGKCTGYEEDINVPLIVRGPGVAKNVTTNLVTTHTDLVPTFFDLLGIDPHGKELDGEAFPISTKGVQDAMAKEKRREHVTVEYWGSAVGEGIYDFDLSAYNNTYKSLRVISEDYDLYYSVWCNNERELYDMKTDPFQLHNLLLHPSSSSSSSISPPFPLPSLLPRLTALLSLLKTCKSTTCTHPWATLHSLHHHSSSSSSAAAAAAAVVVQTLRDAMHPSHDHFYEVELPARGVGVWFERCEKGFLEDAEGGGGDWERAGLSWDLWT